MIAPTGDLLLLQQFVDAVETLNFLHGYIRGVWVSPPEKGSNFMLHTREAKRLPYKADFCVVIRHRGMR